MAAARLVFEKLITISRHRRICTCIALAAQVAMRNPAAKTEA